MKATTLMRFTLVILTLFIGYTAFAQKGTIRGTITDAQTGEPLMFTSVYVKNTDPPMGAQTDLDGKYEIKITAGTYTLEVSYVGYATNTITEVQVAADSVTILDFSMKEQTETLQEVVVQANRIDRTENALLVLQKKATTIQDGISAEEISRFGSNNAAETMKRVTGASVVDGKYVYVRGLGDRYSAAQLNGQQLPSTDPYRNSMQLDLIPSNLLDNVIASKTFTPDQPGNFTGGNVNLQTKAFPERFTLQASVSFSYNTLSTFNDEFLTHEGGSTDWLGYDDGFRDIPDILVDSSYINTITRSSAILARRDAELANQIDSGITSLNQQRAPTTKTSGANTAVSFSVGNQYEVGGNPLGAFIGVNFRRNFSHYSDGAFNYFELTDPESPDLNINRDLDDTRSIMNAQLGGMASLSYKFGGSNKVSFIAIYNHTGAKESRALQGPFPAIISGNGEFQTRALRFQEREFINYQLSGEHVLGESGLKLEWSGSAVTNTQESPDFRQFSNTFRIRNETDTSYFITPAEFSLPVNFFRELEDQQYNGKLDFTLPIAQGESKFNQIKVGGFYSTKDRFFRDNVYQIELGNADPYNGDPTEFFGDDNIGITSFDPDASNPYMIGLYARSFAKSTNENSYDGTESVAAGYAMLNYDFKFVKVIAGARVETTDIELENLLGDTAAIQTTDLLPSVNLIFPVNDESNIRASFSQTLARPNMRELAPFVSFDFGGDFLIQGSPDLNRTLIQNFDLRYEIFPNPGEVFALSAYYKSFDDPIVTAFDPESPNPLIRYVNVDQAEVYGVELELRKSLGFITPALNNMKFSTNLSLIESVVDIAEADLPIIEEFIPEKGDTRPFNGQSPFLVNVALQYVSREQGIDAVLALNVFGERLSDISQARNPDIYEQPRPQLDFTFSKSLTDRVGIKVSASNLLNPDYQTTMEYQGQEYIITNFRRGAQFGLSLKYSI